MMALSRMNIKSAVNSVTTVVGGLLLFVIGISLVLGFYIGSSMQKPSTTVVVERPGMNNYRGWWGSYGAGLPGWGGPKYPPMPPPHPKPPKGSLQPPMPPANPPA